MWPETKAAIEAQFHELHLLLETYSDLISRAMERQPDRIEAAALGAVLHSFYGGVENILKRIAVEADSDLPRGDSWHAELLNSMAEPSPNRPAVISLDTRNRLRDYLTFRHLFRSIYARLLRGEKITPLAVGCAETLERFSGRYGRS